MADGENRMGFAAQERDEESRYFAMGFRQYDCTIGRFLSLDPLMDKFPEQSPYSYANNNPISFKDPSGLEPEGEKGRDEIQTYEGMNPDEYNEWFSQIKKEYEFINYQYLESLRSLEKSQSNYLLGLSNLLYQQYGVGSGNNSGDRTGSKGDNGILNDPRVQGGLDEVAKSAEEAKKNGDSETEFGVIYYYDKEGKLQKSDLKKGSKNGGLATEIRDFIDDNYKNISKVLTIIHSHPNDKFFSGNPGDLSFERIQIDVENNNYNNAIKEDTYGKIGLSANGFSMIVYCPKNKIYYSYSISDQNEYNINIRTYKLDKSISNYINNPKELLRYLPELKGVIFNFKRRK
jgi:RHS repeat-associated protein